MRPGAQVVRRRLGGGGARTVVLCAAMRLAGAGRSLLLRALPSVVLVDGSAGEPVPGLGRLLDGIRDEVRGRRPGAPVMAARFAELLLLQAIRAELERPAPPGSWRAALASRTSASPAPWTRSTRLRSARGPWPPSRGRRA
ncbi:cupin domain-containing protein [Sorangium sp. So ce1024]|uniref:cupin domain-containing protein n=1 Tax=Sorangium sp. So ce1024 TaxID=3133327 RepID=UPI003F0C4EB7